MAKKPTEPAPEATDDAVAPKGLRKPDLFAEIVARTDLKKRDVKPAVEAALAILGETLSRGEDVVLPPLGKVRVVRSKEIGGGAEVLTLKLRTPKTTVPVDGTTPGTDDDDN